MLAGLAAGWAWEYGLVGFMQGPIAKATNELDLSWLTGSSSPAVLYYVLRPFLMKEPAPQVQATA